MRSILLLALALAMVAGTSSGLTSISPGSAPMDRWGLTNDPAFATPVMTPPTATSVFVDAPATNALSPLLQQETGTHSSIETPETMFTSEDVIALNDDFLHRANTELRVPPPGLLLNDVERDEGDWKAVVIRPPMHGKLELASNGGFSYEPNPYWIGEDVFWYQCTDGSMESGLAEVRIGRVNRPPASESDEFNVRAGEILEIPAPGVLGNDSDPDGYPPLARLVAGPSSGELKFRADGGFTY